jgi:hypothetical protein
MGQYCDGQSSRPGANAPHPLSRGWNYLNDQLNSTTGHTSDVLVGRLSVMFGVDNKTPELADADRAGERFRFWRRGVMVHSVASWWHCLLVRLSTLLPGVGITPSASRGFTLHCFRAADLTRKPTLRAERVREAQSFACKIARF